MHRQVDDTNKQFVTRDITRLMIIINCKVAVIVITNLWPATSCYHGTVGTALVLADFVMIAIDTYYIRMPAQAECMQSAELKSTAASSSRALLIAMRTASCVAQQPLRY